jgi:hypothetical protein
VKGNALNATGLLLAQQTKGDIPPEALIFVLGILFVELVLIILVIAGMWGTFQKAGQPG